MILYFHLLLRFSFDWEDNQTMETELETSWNSLKILRYASFFHSLSFVLDVLDINMIGNGQFCNGTVYRICLKLSTKIPPIARDFILSHFHSSFVSYFPLKLWLLGPSLLPFGLWGGCIYCIFCDWHNWFICCNQLSCPWR